MEWLPVQISVDDYNNFFTRLGKSSSIKIYNPPNRLQRGGSLFGLLGRAIRYSIPFIKELILPQIPSLYNNVRHDINEGQAVRSSLRKRALQSVKNIGAKVLNRGGGIRKRNKTNRNRQKNIRKTKKKTFEKLEKFV